MLGLEKIISYLTGFIETKIELIKLDIQEKTTLFVQLLIKFLLNTFLVFIGLLLLVFSISFLIGELTGYNSLGFFIGFVITGLLIYFINKGFVGKIIEKETKKVVNQLFDNSNDRVSE